jgi:TonB family protein
MTLHKCTALTIKRKTSLYLAALLLCSASVYAQDPPCKSKGGEIHVVYPDIAKRMKISGVVRLQLQLTPSGTVRESKVLGGNPLLVGAAQQAVQKAKFEGTDTCIAVFEFRE